METYYFNLEGISKDTIRELIRFCKSKEMFYETDYLEMEDSQECVICWDCGNILRLDGYCKECNKQVRIKQQEKGGLI